MFFRCFFCTVRLSIFERFVFASFEPLRFCKKVRFVFPDLNTLVHNFFLIQHFPINRGYRILHYSTLLLYNMT